MELENSLWELSDVYLSARPGAAGGPCSTPRSYPFALPTLVFRGCPLCCRWGRVSVTGRRGYPGKDTGSLDPGKDP